LWLDTKKHLALLFSFFPIALDPAKCINNNNKRIVGFEFFCYYHLWHNGIFFLVVLLVRVNTEVVAATWTNALGGRVAVSARLASIIKMKEDTSASVHSATWANIATWK
jgi:hypothetical protein